VVTDLASETTVTTSAEFSAQVEAELSSSAFQTSLLTGVTSASGVGSVTTTAATRSPTIGPAHKPSDHYSKLGAGMIALVCCWMGIWGILWLWKVVLPSQTPQEKSVGV
jgi:hypothetical protein